MSSHNPDARGSVTILTVFRGKSKVAGVQHIGILTGYAQHVVVHVEYVGSFGGLSFVFLKLVGSFFLFPIYAGCA
jgi:hypothetical protein